jgi:hypothetical protein
MATVTEPGDLVPLLLTLTKQRQEGSAGHFVSIVALPASVNDMTADRSLFNASSY